MAAFKSKKLPKTRSRALCSILKAARTKAGLTLEQVEAETHIPIKHLQALELGAYHLLPAEAYNVGFVRSYAEILKINSEKIVQLYREERSQYRIEGAVNAVRFQPKKVGDWTFLITPKLIAVVGMVVLFGGISTYIYLQVRKFAEPPALVMDVPSEFSSDRDTVKIGGRTAEGAIVSMNTEPITVDPHGTFSQEVQLSPGLNQIVVMSRSRAQKESRTTLKILYQQDFARANPVSASSELTP